MHMIVSRGGMCPQCPPGSDAYVIFLCARVIKGQEEPLDFLPRSAKPQDHKSSRVSHIAIQQDSYMLAQQTIMDQFRWTEQYQLGKTSNLFHVGIQHTRMLTHRIRSYWLHRQSQQYMHTSSLVHLTPLAYRKSNTNQYKHFLTSRLNDIIQGQPFRAEHEHRL